MKKEIAQLWIKALKSGDYKQGKNQLRKEDRFCCLGVLCNLHAQAHPKIAATQRHAWVYMREGSVLPAPVRHWAGMRSVLGAYGSSAGYLADDNDNGQSFKQIAATIEKHWRDL